MLTITRNGWWVLEKGCWQASFLWRSRRSWTVWLRATDLQDVPEEEWDRVPIQQLEVLETKGEAIARCLEYVGATGHEAVEVHRQTQGM